MKKFTVILTAGLFLMAQTTHGEWAFLNSLSIPQGFNLQAEVKPAMIPSMVNTVLFPQAVESKEIWVGDKTLSFHVTARESLQTAYRPSFSTKIPAAIWKIVKQPLLYSLLVAVTRETKTEPLHRNFGVARQLSRSA